MHASALWTWLLRSCGPWRRADDGWGRRSLSLLRSAGGPPPQLLSAPEGGGPPARRPRREPSARRVGSKPGQALPPPSGTAAARMSKGCPAAALGHSSCPHVEGVPCRRPRAPQPPAYRRGALPPALEYRSRPHAEGVPCHPPRPRSRPCARAGSRSGYTHTKSPGPNGPGDSPSGWRDLNPRPLRPERSALPSCATPRCPMSIAIPRRKTQTEIGGQWEVCATPQR